MLRYNGRDESRTIAAVAGDSRGIEMPDCTMQEAALGRGGENRGGGGSSSGGAWGWRAKGERGVRRPYLYGGTSLALAGAISRPGHSSCGALGDFQGPPSAPSAWRPGKTDRPCRLPGCGSPVRTLHWTSQKLDISTDYGALLVRKVHGHC